MSKAIDLITGSNLYENKAVLFYSAPKAKYIPILRKYNIRNLLLSYWYIRQKWSDFQKFVEYLREVDGVLMVDSGAHTFKSDKENVAHWRKPESYDEYINEYVQFCYDYAPDIYCCVNIDMDKLVGVDVVDRWNEKYFRPLNKVTNVIFNVDSHLNRKGVMDHSGGLIRLKEYAKEFDYIGVNRRLANKYSNQVYKEAMINKCKVHGFAVTSLAILRSSPFFSVDSTSWLMGDIYGVSYTYDGKNFKGWDKKQKYVRTQGKILAKTLDIDHNLLKQDKTYQVTEFNLYAWKGFEKEYMNFANLKLNTLSLKYYDKRRKEDREVIPARKNKGKS